MSMDTPADFGDDPAADVRRWLKELDLAEKTEKDWRKSGDDIWKRYRGTQRKKNSYNILWSNTETLAPALFNTPPSPDVRRRFRDEDPVGKQVSTVLERCLEFQTDTEQFMHSVKQDVLDAILPGRGLSRVKYVPEFAPMDPTAAPVADADEAGDKETPEGDEILAWEQCELEHVQWDDFRHGPGKTWREVCWVSFRHRMTRDELEGLCGDLEIAKVIPMDQTDDDSINKDEQLKTTFGTAVVWEFWCKDERLVKFIAPGYGQKPLKTVADPLKLIDFYPIPRPLYAIFDSSTLIPTSLWSQYEEQADELDRVSTRINRVVNALKVRGIYDSTVAELGQLMAADDNKLIPIQNASLAAAWQEKGGLEKAIYWMPIEQMANVLKVLHEQRDATKQVIYELSGIADVRRGATDPNETLGAQKLKADFGSQRIAQLKLEIERYVRDLMRLMSEIVATKFGSDTLLRMSNMQIPTEVQIQQQVQQTQQQATQQAQQSVQPGQDPQQAVQQAVQQAMQQLGPRPISLEQVMQVLHDDATRMFKIDVETDSMISATAQDDMAGLHQVLGGITEFINGVGPAVQMGAFPIDAVKEIVMTICRRSKMGSAVEDALDKIQAPDPSHNPAAMKMQMEQQAMEMKMQSVQQVAQAKAQADAASDQARAQADMRIAHAKGQNEAQIAQIKAQMQVEIEAAAQHAQQQTEIVREQALAQQHRAKLDHQAQIAVMQAHFDEQQKLRDMQFEQWKAEKAAETSITVAEIGAQATLTAAQNSAADSAARD